MLPQLREIQFECPQKSWLAEIVTLCINFEEVRRFEVDYRSLTEVD